MTKKANLILILTLILAFGSFLANAQNQSVDVVLDSIKIEEKTNLLFAGISYISNSTKNQNFKDTKIPTLIGDLTFYHYSGFYASAVYSNYINAVTKTYEAELQLGYQKTVLDFLNLDFYYGYRYFNGDDSYESIDYSHIISLNSNAEISFLTFNVNNYMFIGKSRNYFLDLEAGITYDFENVFIKNDFLNINPSVSIFYGTDHWIYDNMRNHHMNTIQNYLYGLNYQTHIFEYQSLNFIVPIIYNISNYSISFSWIYSIPSEKFKSLNWDDQNAFMISIIYSPNL